MANIVSTEPLEQAEIIFVLKRYQRASKDYMRVMNLILVMCGIVPLVIAIMFWIYGAAVDFVINVFFLLLLALVVFFIIVACIYYFLQIFNKYRDAVYKTKKVESCMITEKREIPANHTFHFFIDSRVKYSIEVPEAEYQLYEAGDEINIEYSSYDKEYFGYY